MQWTSRRTAMGLLGLVGLTLAGATMLGPDKPPPQPFGPAGSGLSTTDTGSIGSEPDDDRTVITLGDLDAPPAPAFPPAPIDDPCTVIDRDDLPAAARPAEDPVRTPEPPANARMGCRLDYRQGPGPVALVITITWAPTGTWPDPPDHATHPGAAAATFAGRPGLERTATDPQGQVICLGLMPAGAGTAAARVSNSRYPTVHPCAVAAAVLTAIAHQTS